MYFCVIEKIFSRECLPIMLNGFAKFFVISWVNVIAIVLAKKSHCIIICNWMIFILLKLDLLLYMILVYPSKFSDNGVMSRFMVVDLGSF